MQKNLPFLLLLILSVLFVSVNAQAQKPADSLAAGRDTAGGRFHQALDTFTLVQGRPVLQRKPGRITLHVAGSPIAAGGNASDIIRHIPGIDGLQYHGKTILILIDGHNTGLKREDLQAWLDGLGAGSIDRVELIENPGARYDAQGGVVLNIITARIKKQGFSGTVSTGAGLGKYAQYNEGISLNYQAGKLNGYAGYDYLHSKRWYTSYSQRAIDPGGLLTESADGVRPVDNHNFRLGLDYAISRRSSAGIQLRGMWSRKQELAGSRSILQGKTAGADSVADLTTTGHSRFFIPSAGIWYKISLDSTGRELAVSADYFHYSKRRNDLFLTSYMDSRGMAGLPVFGLRDQSPADNGILALSLDYVYPSRIGKWEVGAKTSLTNTDNDARWDFQQDSSWVTDRGKTNHFLYREQINALYLNYGKAWGKWAVQAGLRAEQTRTKGRSVTLDQTDNNSYLTLFPSLNLQYNFSGDQQWGFSYQKRIERFDFETVNPFIRYTGPYSWYQGNPAIRPSISHNWSLSWSWQDALMASVSYGHFLDALGDVFHPADTGHAVIQSESNLGTAEQLEADLSYSKSLYGGKWVLSASAGLLYAKYNTLTDSRQRGAQWSVYASLDQVFTVGRGWKMELSGMYYSPMVLGVVRYDSRFSMDLGITKSVWKNRGKIAFNLSDLFNSAVSKYDVASYGVLSSNRKKTENRIGRLVFTWAFGGKGGKSRQGRKSGIDDLRERMNAN